MDIQLLFFRFLFGIPYNTIESLYSVPPEGDPDPFADAETDDIVGRIPIVGLFSMSNTVDRIIIQVYFQNSLSHKLMIIEKSGLF